MKQLEARMEVMELGLLQTQEALSCSREESSAIRESVQRELEKSREETARTLDHFGQRIDSMFNMLSTFLPQLCLSAAFPPRSTSNSTCLVMEFFLEFQDWSFHQDPLLIQSCLVKEFFLGFQECKRLRNF